MQTKFEITPKQAEYIRNANHRWNIACGAVRSGKSYLQISYLIPTRLLERKDKRGLIVFLGATRANIERNILQPLRDVYGPDTATEINHKNWAKVFGVKVYCIGADNVHQVSKLRGSEISYCAVDEGTDINPEVFEMLKSRLSLPWSCCDITTNPNSPNHWFKKFIDSREQGVDIYLQEYTIYDNPFLPKEYVRNLEAEYAGSVWFDRYILGKWTLAEGLIYPNFALALYDEDFEEPAEEYWISLDYGTSNPFAALLWEKRGKVWYCSHEYGYSGRETGTQLTDGQYLERLKNNLICYIPEVKRNYIPAIADPSAASFIALLNLDGHFGVRKGNNDVITGIREVNTCIQTGKIKVHKRNRGWLQEVQSYRWDEDAGEDKVIKEFDHFMDSMRYFVKTKRIASQDDTYQSRFGR